MSFDLVLFGGTGDLAWRKLLPALFQAFRHGSLPPQGRIIGVARDALSDDDYRALIARRFADVEGEKRPSDEEFERFAALLQYQRMDLSQPEDYALLARRLRERHADTVVMYLATAPALFTTVCEQLGAAGLATPATRVVLEKPLGHDLASNRAINAHADAIRDEKLKVLRSLSTWTPATLLQDVVRGQYSTGTTACEGVGAYADEDGVAPGSTTETFVALRTEIANWRWAGVPFYIRTGKRLAAREAHIAINFRPTPHAIYRTPLGAANRLVIHLQPRDGLALHLFAAGQEKRGMRISEAQALAPVQLDLDFDQRFGSQRVGAYERLLLDVIAGRLNLFVRADEQEAAWHWVEPIMQAWAEQDARGEGPRPYAAGSWGPSAASALVAREGHTWMEEC